jgi:hypothetical protein
MKEIVTLAIAGTLKKCAFTHPAEEITNLTVIGVIDARDIRFMRDSMPILKVVDLGGVTILGYSGGAGTLYGSSISYLVDEMPETSFFNLKRLKGKTSLVSVILPSDLTSIGAWGFSDCSGLTGTLTLPSGITSIGMAAFSGCSGLTGALTLPSGITSIGFATFAACSGLTGVLTLPSGLTDIEDYAFSGCSRLTKITNLNPVPVAISATVFDKVKKSTCVLKVPANSVSLYQAAAVWKDFKIRAIE